MAQPPKSLDWCVIRLGDDMNWWVKEISDNVRWDVDGLGILDPRQMSYILEVCDDLTVYGFEPEIIDQAFYSFAVAGEASKAGDIRVSVSQDSLLEDEMTLFALPDSLDEEKGPYADFLDQITKARVKKLNDLIEFDKSLTIEELEEEIRERQNSDYMEGRAVHPFSEISAILDYVPAGYELEGDEEGKNSEEEDIGDIPDFEESDEKLEEDETMKWDEDEEKDDEEEDEDSDEDEDGDEDEDEEEDDKDEDDDAPRRSRRR